MQGGEIAKMHGNVLVAAGHRVQVAIQPLGEERRDGRDELGNRFQAGVKRLIGRNLVLTLTALPETATTQAHVPVAQPFVNESLYHAAGTGRFILVQGLVHSGHERVELGKDPTVDFRTGSVIHFGLLVGKAVDIGIKGKETVSIVERSEELALHFGDAFLVELEIVPRLRIDDHVPARGVGTVLVDGLERIHGVAQAFGHLVAVLVQHQAVRDHVLVGHRTEHHRGDGMQREEPAARLVDTFGDEVGRKVVRELFLVLERIMELGVRHRTAVKPNVDQVGLTEHLLARGRNQHDFIHIGTMQVETGIVFVAVVALLVGGERVGTHESGRYRLVYPGFQFGHRTYAGLFGTVFRNPYGQRRSPITGTGKVPVHEVLEPVAETTRTRGFGFPAYGLVERDHLVLAGSGTDEPRIERIIDDRLVGPPAMRIRVFVLFGPEREVSFFSFTMMSTSTATVVLGS